MAQQKRIDKGLYWDRAWSLIEGCSFVSPGCAHCWSAQQAHIRAGQSNPKIRARYGGLTDSHGCWTGEIRLMEQDLDKPLRVRKPTTWAIWNDLFHDDVPDDFIIEVFCKMGEVPRHTFLILTKRADRMQRFISGSTWGLSPLRNVGLGVTAENQEAWDYRTHYLRQTPAAFRFVSVEPMLGPINTRDGLRYRFPGSAAFSSDNWPSLDWIICGSETGPGKRQMELDWARSLRDECEAAGVPFFFKKDSNGSRLLDGREWNEFPEAKQ